MEIKISEKKLYSLIKKAVDEAMHKHLQEIKLSMVASCDDDEMQEIKTMFGSPKKYKKQKCCIKKI